MATNICEKSTRMRDSEIEWPDLTTFTCSLACEQQRSHVYGWVNWTVAADTPDVVYYQSFYAYGLGWKIHVLDEGEEPDAANPSAGVLKIVTTPSKEFTTSSGRLGAR